jgi:diguanylate cyclase (GGDEF)-like protein
MDEVGFSGNAAPFQLISEILGDGLPAGSPVRSIEKSCLVAKISTCDYPDFDSFLDAYRSLGIPAICMIDLDFITAALPMVKATDEIGLIGEPPGLTTWRFDKLAKSCAKQLDPITQVYQRSHLLDSLAVLCPVASRLAPVSLILLDIDGFKGINDEFGPAEGNRVLKQLGELVQTLCRMTLVARTRGGEFGILVQADEFIALRVAKIIKGAVNDSNWCAFPNVTVSFGVASISKAEKPTKILVRADEAMFSAKANGRDRIVCYSEIVEASNQTGEDAEVITLENKARVMSERVTSFVTQQSRMIMQNLRREANTDPLTQLFNRRYLDKTLEEDFEAAIAGRLDLSVALLDVDHFGEVNKKYGWPTGDQTLQQIAQLIEELVRGRDWVGRYGGEEICVVMPGATAGNAHKICERIREAIESNVFNSTDGQPFNVTLSVGVAALDPKLDATPKDLIERISQLALAAKNGGRNRVVAELPA